MLYLQFIWKYLRSFLKQTCKLLKCQGSTLKRSGEIKKRKHVISPSHIVKSSVVEPEPDFLAGAGAGKKARLRAVAVWLRVTVVAK